jgi:polyisoprenoid-binding protein YceI
MKNLFVIGCLVMLSSSTLFAQKYMTRTGKINFDATTKKSPEKIAGVNNEVANILDAQTGDVVFQVLIKSFKFESELMQEHFNENYMESDKYPKAEFKGNITDHANVNFSKDGNYNVHVTGKLTIHGVTKEVTTAGTIVVKGNTVTAKANFSIVLKDYNVEVPALVADKVNKDATISLESNLTKK